MINAFTIPDSPIASIQEAAKRDKSRRRVGGPLEFNLEKMHSKWWIMSVHYPYCKCYRYQIVSNSIDLWYDSKSIQLNFNIPQHTDTVYRDRRLDCLILRLLASWKV